MKDLVKKAELERQFHIESAATSTEELGNPVYPQHILPCGLKISCVPGVGYLVVGAARKLHQQMDLAVVIDAADAVYVSDIGLVHPDQEIEPVVVPFERRHSGDGIYPPSHRDHPLCSRACTRCLQGSAILRTPAQLDAECGHPGGRADGPGASMVHPSHPAVRMSPFIAIQ